MEPSAGALLGRVDAAQARIDRQQHDVLLAALLDLKSCGRLMMKSKLGKA